MTSVFEQQCPLCQCNSEYESRDFGNLKHYLCPTCIEFAISVGAEKRLLESIHQWRTALSDKAKLSDKEKILVITRTSTALVRRVVDVPVLNAEFVKREKLFQ
jgi:hypothetical protein